MHDRQAVLASLERAASRLLLVNPFYGHVLLCAIRVVTEEVETAAVTVRNGALHLLVNPVFWLRTLESDAHRVGVLKHEILHVVLGHLQRARQLEHAERMNVAADLAVNCLVEEELLPASALRIDTPGLLALGDRLWGQTMEWYYARLASGAAATALQQSSDTRGQGAEIWAEGDPVAAAAVTAEVVRQGAQAAGAEALARLPGDLRRVVEETVAHGTGTRDWRRMVRLFGTGSRRTRIRTTLKRPSKRFGKVPGIRVQPLSHLAVVLDTSGSIEPRQLAAFFGEVRAIWRAGATITVVESDQEVGRVWNYRGQAPTETSGGGGTDFDPAIAWVNERAQRIDGVIFMTDGQGARTLDCRRRILWLITGGSDAAERQREIGRRGESFAAMRV